MIPRMRMRKSNAAFRLLPVAGLLAAMVLPLGAKSKHEAAYSIIAGTVFGADGRPTGGVPVKIRRADSNKAGWEMVSDRRGEFAQRLPAAKADYVVWLPLKDKAAAQRTEVKVHVENDERQDISLHLIEDISHK